MDDLQDDLDLRYHRGLQPDVYYRCPTLESLGGALQNEAEKSASSLIPLEIVTEFIFATSSTITIPVAHQLTLDALIEPADYLQSITVDCALCRNIDGKDRLKAQRAIARSIIAAIQEADGFKYFERSAQNKEGGDGTRFKYVCQDSLQYKSRQSSIRKERKLDNGVEEDPSTKGYDCGGAIHIKFSLKREAINVVYKHNPIHSSPAHDESIISPQPAETFPTPAPTTPKVANGTKEPKKKRKPKPSIDIEAESRDHDLDMSTSPEAPKTSAKNKRKKSTVPSSPASHRKSVTKKTKTAKNALSPSSSRKNTQFRDPSSPPKPIKYKSCIRCRQKKIKCDEAKPSCNQCRRGLWTCQYELPVPKQRSKNGCVNCKTRKRKCTEERPSCAHCLKVDDDCQYADYS